MNVLHIVSWYSEYHAKDLSAGVFHNEFAKALQSKCNVAIWYPIDKSITDELTAEEEWGVLTFRSRKRDNTLSLLSASIKAFKRIMQEFRPDIIHAHVTSEAGLIATAIGLRFSIPFIVTEHAPVEIMGLDRLKRRIRYRLVYGASAQNICVSDDLAEKLSRLFPGQKFNTIYNGVSDPVAFLSDPPPHVRVDGHINIGVVSLFYDKEVKGFQYLLPAIKKVNDALPVGVVLHICGDGEFLDYYKRMAEELGINNNCCFYGHCERKQVFDIVSQMDFGVSASLFESAGVSVEEMLLLGKPVVVTKSGGVNSLVSEENAVIVEKGSTEALIQGIIEMCNIYKQFDRKSIRFNACMKFEMKEIIDQYIESYNQLNVER